MPTDVQLSNPPVPTDGDGSSKVTNDDGSTTTTWPDGTVRVDYTNGSAMITFPDGAVLNLYADGTRTLNDANGVALDPQTGQSLQTNAPAPTAPVTGPDRILRILHGDEAVENVTEAADLLSAFKDALEGEINPVDIVEQVIEMVLQVVKAMETEERGCQIRGWCYGLMYGALNMGSPPEPAFSGSLQGPDQDALDHQAWDAGVSSAQQQLGTGQDGVALRNKVLLRVAYDGSQPATTLDEIWHASCTKSGDQQLAAAYPSLSWPAPTGA